MELIDGKKIAATIKQELSEEVKKIKDKKGKIPHLAVVIIGDDPSSEIYVNSKIKACREVGFQSTKICLDDSISEEDLLKKVERINLDDDVDGLIVQMPLPEHISEEKVIESIAPEKDVDGFHPRNIGKMAFNLPTYIPATPYGILSLIKRYNIETEGKHCVVIGRSNIVGTPMGLMISRKDYPGNATLSLCHSYSENIAELTKTADIIITALGKPEFLTADMVKEGVVIFDIGITRVKSDKTKSGWKLLGDVKFDEVAPKCKYITPVPGGVGPMTIVSLLKNTLKAAKKEVYKN